MFKRPRHATIHKLLAVFNAGVLSKTQRYLGGGTAIALLPDEYRESEISDALLLALKKQQPPL